MSDRGIFSKGDLAPLIQIVFYFSADIHTMKRKGHFLHFPYTAEVGCLEAVLMNNDRFIGGYWRGHTKWHDSPAHETHNNIWTEGIFNFFFMLTG